jgi:hypothetical protein
VIPTINVSLKPCNHAAKGSPLHAPYCDSAPILIPCPIQRSVTFEVVLGSSDPIEYTSGGEREQWCSHQGHRVKVSCSISGKTWEESEVSDSECARTTHDDHVCAKEGLDVLQVCRDRWALVKALVLGKPQEGLGGALIIAPMDLFARRDAVFSALAEMARAEEASKKALSAVISALPEARRWAPTSSFTANTAERMLERYVERLIEQVGAMS